jgi:hypothetical protein
MSEQPESIVAEMGAGKKEDPSKAGQSGYAGVMPFLFLVCKPFLHSSTQYLLPVLTVFIATINSVVDTSMNAN